MKMGNFLPAYARGSFAAERAGRKMLMQSLLRFVVIFYSGVGNLGVRMF